MRSHLLTVGEKNHQVSGFRRLGAEQDLLRQTRKGERTVNVIRCERFSWEGEAEMNYLMPAGFENIGQLDGIDRDVDIHPLHAHVGWQVENRAGRGIG